jgi:hypothetical protein
MNGVDLGSLFAGLTDLLHNWPSLVMMAVGGC